MAVAKSSVAATTVMAANQYIVNQAGNNATGFYTSRVLVTVNSSGTAGTFKVLSHSVASVLDSGTGIAYSISADGTLTFPGNANWGGIASPDGGVLVISDTTTGGTGDNFFGVGIKKP